MTAEPAEGLYKLKRQASGQVQVFEMNPEI